MAGSRSRGAHGGPEGSVPRAVIARLSLYLRELQHLRREGHETISSLELGRLLGFTDAQVRKDLAYFGAFGYPGIGYRCGELIAAIREILGTNQQWNVALVGAGNLGRALLGYRGFLQQGFRFVAAFDVDPAKIGGRIEGVDVLSFDRLAEIVSSLRIRLAVLAVPASAAQEAADRLVEAGIEGILNFAPVSLTLPGRVSLTGVDLAIELEQLAYAVLRSAGSTDR